MPSGSNTSHGHWKSHSEAQPSPSISKAVSEERHNSTHSHSHSQTSQYRRSTASSPIHVVHPHAHSERPSSASPQLSTNTHNCNTYLAAVPQTSDTSNSSSSGPRLEQAVHSHHPFRNCGSLSDHHSDPHISSNEASPPSTSSSGKTITPSSCHTCYPATEYNSLSHYHSSPQACIQPPPYDDPLRQGIQKATTSLEYQNVKIIPDLAPVPCQPPHVLRGQSRRSPIPVGPKAFLFDNDEEDDIVFIEHRLYLEDPDGTGTII